MVASFRRRHPPATCPSLHPGPGKPPLTPPRPPSRGLPRPRPSPFYPRRRPRGACHVAPGDTTLSTASAARAVELPIPGIAVCRTDRAFRAPCRNKFRPTGGRSGFNPTARTERRAIHCKKKPRFRGASYAAPRRLSGHQALRRRIPPRLASPSPSRARVAGAGTPTTSRSSFKRRVSSKSAKVAACR